MISWRPQFHINGFTTVHRIWRQFSVILLSPFLKKCCSMTSSSLKVILKVWTWLLQGHPQHPQDHGYPCSWIMNKSFTWFIFASIVKIFTSERTLRQPSALCFNERIATENYLDLGSLRWHLPHLVHIKHVFKTIYGIQCMMVLFIPSVVNNLWSSTPWSSQMSSSALWMTLGAAVAVFSLKWLCHARL